MTQATSLPGMLALWASSHIAGGNAEYVDALYEAYLQDPNGIPPEWRDYFDQLPRVATATTSIHNVPHSVLRDRFARISKKTRDHSLHLLTRSRCLHLVSARRCDIIFFGVK